MYDKLDWHVDAALEAGQPEEHGFVHIGFYLAWLIRHDLHEPSWFPPEHVAALKAGEMSGSDLADDIDAKLGSAEMSPEGRAFSDARYRRYLEAYAQAFADVPDYGVADEPPNEVKAAAVIDDLYASWVADGRPAAPDTADADQAALDWMRSLPVEFDPPLESTTVNAARDPAQRSTEEFGGVVLRAPDDTDVPHVAPHLESLVPNDLARPPIVLWSVPASQWGSSVLKRALKRLDVSARDAVVVNWMGGDGDATLVVTLYGVPGISADRLDAEFRSVISRMPGSAWEGRDVAGRQVTWASGEEFSVAFWARDGLVVHVAGDARVVEEAIPRLP
jgi:hypothetical protein